MESVTPITRNKFFACVSRSADTRESNLCSWQDFVIHCSILLEKQIIVFTLVALQSLKPFIVKISLLRVEFQVAFMATCIVRSHLKDRDFLLGEFIMLQFLKL